MTTPITSREMQRVTFVESIHNTLKKQATKAIADHGKFLTIAKAYVQDGLEESECIELLMIDGLSRSAAESYATMALSTEEEQTVEGLYEYAFQFEDTYGKRWSSFDIGKTVHASNDKEAWDKAEEMLDLERGDENGIEPEKVVYINRVC